jgi:hypothetical protein
LKAVEHRAIETVRSADEEACWDQTEVQTKKRSIRCSSLVRVRAEDLVDSAIMGTLIELERRHDESR